MGQSVNQEQLVTTAPAALHFDIGPHVREIPSMPGTRRQECEMRRIFQRVAAVIDVPACGRGQNVNNVEGG